LRVIEVEIKIYLPKKKTKAKLSNNSNPKGKMSTFHCRVQYLDDSQPFNTTNFPEPTRPPKYPFLTDVPIINQIAGVHSLLKAPLKVLYHSDNEI
jgi:hypothetical protein